MLNRMLALVSASLLTVASYALAADLRTDHPDTYVVKKGDTLWNISARFLNKPWLWPEIWHANPQIHNPHLIYPGDVLSLKYIDGKPQVEMTRGVALGPAVDTIPLSQVEDFLKNLRVIDNPKTLPYIVGLEEDQVRVTNGQLAYARGIPNAQPGDMFAIVRPTVAYGRNHRGSGEYQLRSDDLDFRGNKLNGTNWNNYWKDVSYGRRGQPDYLGTEMKEMSLAQVTRAQGHGIETTTLLLMGGGAEVRTGDRLVPVEAQPYDLQFFPHPPKQQATTADYTRYRVIGVPDNIAAAGPREVVAISGGKLDNIDNGTVFSVWRIGSNAADHVAHHNALAADHDRVKLADEYEGHVMVFRAFDRMSYALVMDGTKDMQVGDILKHPDATR
ncbi:MAG: LysM peptidoglycan-binding domain-containing protein [Proteobacteria bacterium]|nr:LysM peptidoglycan-binding domain-containing protein [Pseudomonadota bacterium]MBS0462319.1 LysM peptidoglycan-binding domain-containing protein [Pseudomonadota bacterium]MBS0465047.1 LysM peptidoglycan-binding domain-containing protein [Pseudomonadota bacterium]